MELKNGPVVLCVLDGWGIGPDNSSNAISNANPMCFNDLIEHCPNSKLYTSGEKVGLPEGQMGNSEVGHMTIGSGRVIEQDLLKINKLITSGKFFTETNLHQFLEGLNREKNTCHLVGLISDGGVHSHIDHVLALAEFLNDHKIRTCIHVITDGRDVLPRSSINFVTQI